MLIILESPHINEFKHKTLDPSPALGATGINLQRCLVSKLNDFIIGGGSIPSGDYKVILANAIQYQASLGYCTEMFRDRCWLMMWLSKGLQDFIRRIDLYNPDVIINACTNGSHKCDPFFEGKENIRLNFLKDVNSNIIQNPSNGELELQGRVIYDPQYLEVEPKQIKNKNYLLRGFVMTALSQNKFPKGSSPIFLYSVHPSSRHFTSKNKLNKFNHPIRNTFFKPIL